MDHDDHLGFVADCRLRAATDVLVHTWDPVVMAALREGPRRRVDLRRAIGGISDKALSDTLRRLTRMQLTTRTTFAAAPPHVDYGLTELGRSFVEGPLLALGRWAADHAENMLPDEHPAPTPTRHHEPRDTPEPHTR